MGRRAFIETPAARALRLRVMALRRKPRPTHSRGDKHAWISEFMALFDAQAWKAMQPPETRLEYLRNMGLGEDHTTHYRNYLQVYQAALDAGANHYHLRVLPYSVFLPLKAHLTHPNKLLEALLGSEAARERRRKIHNRARRQRSRSSAAS